jgi:hypothetical protein
MKTIRKNQGQPRAMFGSLIHIFMRIDRWREAVRGFARIQTVSHPMLLGSGVSKSTETNATREQSKRIGITSY